jgi:hypothetical protein
MYSFEFLSGISDARSPTCLFSPMPSGSQSFAGVRDLQSCSTNDPVWAGRTVRLIVTTKHPARNRPCGAGGGVSVLREDDHSAWTPWIFDWVLYQAGQTGWRVPCDKPLKASQVSRRRKSIIDHNPWPRGNRLPLPAPIWARGAPSVPAIARSRPERSIHGIITVIV